MRVSDFRSDTVTKPSAAMRQAMSEAEVGDDVLGEDPTINALEQKTAALLGKEAALFVPTGTMGNQIAIGVHAGPGDELLCASTSHVYVWEGGGIARLSGVTTRPIDTPNMMLNREVLEGKIRPDDGHYVRTRLVTLENTHNRGGGKVHPIDDVRAISAWARGHGIAMHLDGARLMNAVVASGIAADVWAKEFDTISLCFSKGLGAPVGSAIVGTVEHIRKAHRLRKVFGGGMRQAGIIAAGALFALEKNVPRLADDHANAQIIAQAIEETDGFQLESGTVETNLVWFQVDPRIGTAAEVVAKLRERGILMIAIGPQAVRACTHLDVSTDDCVRAADALRSIAQH